MSRPIPFTVNVDGVDYKCHKEVEKIRKEFKQEITVQGMGYESDPDLYHNDRTMLELMKFRATQIAKEIIKRRLSLNAG